MQVGASYSVPAVATVGLCKFSAGASTSEKRRIECGLATLAGERERDATFCGTFFLVTADFDGSWALLVVRF